MRRSSLTPSDAPVVVARTLAVSNEIIRNCRELGVIESPSRIEILTYFSAGWYLGIHQSPLIFESVFATKDGPAIPILRAQFDSRRDAPILDFSKALNSKTSELQVANVLDYEDGLAIKDFLKTTCRAFRRASIDHLVRTSKLPGGAWSIARAGMDDDRVGIIHPEVMQQEFYSVAREISQRNR